jgi:hypothetical protein
MMSCDDHRVQLSEYITSLCLASSYQIIFEIIKLRISAALSITSSTNSAASIWLRQRLRHAIPIAKFLATREVTTGNQHTAKNMKIKLSNKRHSAAKLQNDVRRTMPRPLVMSIQLSSVVVSSIGWDAFGEVCGAIWL